MVIKNLPQVIHDSLVKTDQRYKDLIVQLQHAKEIQDDDKKDLVLHTIYNEYGKEFVSWEI